MKNKLLNFLILYVPLSNLLNEILYVSFFGFNFWNTVFVFFLIHLLFIIAKPKINEVIILSIFLLLFTVISILRIRFYGVDFSSIITNFWYVYLPLVFLISIKKIRYSKNFYINILFFHTAFLSLIGTLFLLGLPTIEIQSPQTKDLFSNIFHRYEGIYAGANVHANILATFFLMYSLISKNIYKIFILSPFVLMSIVATGSRLGLLIFLMTTLYIFSRKKPIFSLFIVLLSSYFIYTNFDFSNLDLRLINQSLDIEGGRIDKTRLFFNLINENILEVLAIGVPPSFLTKGIVNISDNSLSLLILNSGIIFTIFWFISIKIAFKNFYINLFKNKFLFVIIFLIFILNNAILYLPWAISIFYFIRFYEEHFTIANNQNH